LTKDTEGQNNLPVVNILKGLLRLLVEGRTKEKSDFAKEREGCLIGRLKVKTKDLNDAVDHQIDACDVVRCDGSMRFEQLHKHGAKGKVDKGERHRDCQRSEDQEGENFRVVLCCRPYVDDHLEETFCNAGKERKVKKD